MTAQELRRARRAYRALDAAQQFALASELAHSRRALLMKAHPDLEGVGFGFKTRSDASGRERVVRTPCVVFEVARKHKLARASEAHRRLPAELIVHLGEPGERRACAVPTDVRDAASFGKPRAHTSSTAFVLGPSAGDDAITGAVTCAVRRGGEWFALSCRHVLSRTACEEPDAGSGRKVAVGGFDGVRLGITGAPRGDLVPAPEFSFDAQLLKVGSVAPLATVMAGIKFNVGDAVLERPGDIPNVFWVATPRDGARATVEFRGFPDPARTMAYDTPSGSMRVAHRELIHGRVVKGSLDAGDSGSPALLERSGVALVGMYLGGDGENAYFLPAWNLVGTSENAWPQGAALEIANP